MLRLRTSSSPVMGSLISDNKNVYLLRFGGIDVEVQNFILSSDMDSDQ
jgi:hypothetical protein